MPQCLVMIPARRGSTRLKDKMLILVNNKPIIVYTVERVLQAEHVGRVCVCTDDLDIRDAVSDYFLPNDRVVIKCCPFVCETGTDRTSLTISQYPELLEGMEPSCIIHLHGDEASIHPEALDRLIEHHLSHPCLMTQLLAKTHERDIENKNSCKVIMDWNNRVLEYSRERDSFYTSVGAFAMDYFFLKTFHRLPMGEKEIKTNIEQYRALEQGILVKGFDPNLGEVKSAIDTQEDVDRLMNLVGEWK